MIIEPVSLAYGLCIGSVVTAIGMIIGAIMDDMRRGL